MSSTARIASSALFKPNSYMG